jgi:hypothetical protein
VSLNTILPWNSREYWMLHFLKCGCQFWGLRRDAHPGSRWMDRWIDGCGPRSPNRSQTQHMGPHPSAAAILPSHRIHCRPNVSLIIRSLAPWRQIDELKLKLHSN